MARKIVAIQSLSAAHESRLRQAAPGWELVHGKTQDDWQPHLADAEIIVGWHPAVVEACLRPGTTLRWLQHWGAGVDNFPFEAFASSGVVLTNASGVHANPISETIMAMMLSLTRKLHVSVRNQTQRQWRQIGGLGEMHGKTAGIIGVGAIGEETARLCKAFGMNVLGVKRTPSPCAYVDRMVSMRQLNEVLGESDYVIVTLPLTKDTAHVIGVEQFRAMKPSAFYINIGRGGTTDELALVEALRSGSIAGAGLDVFEVEPLPVSSPLWEMDNVIISAHNTGITVHYDDRAMDIFLRNLQDYLAGSEPQLNRIDLDKQY